MNLICSGNVGGCIIYFSIRIFKYNKYPEVAMSQKGLSNFFESFLKKEPLFINKKVLQSSYTPKNVPYREEQIHQIAGILAPALRLEKPSNIFMYGKPGSGKTLSVRHVAENMLEIGSQKNINLKIVYINCKLKRVSDTEYRIVAQLARELGQDVPSTGLPTDEVYKIFVRLVDEKKQLVILILDEIDQLVNRAGDEILYNLTRLNSELKNAQISLIGISNNLQFTENIDPRIKSSLSEEEILFPPYNAVQLQKILLQRAKLSFRDDVIEEGVIEKCAAYAAREHGDARRALELLRVAGELAERSNVSKVMIKYIDEAEEKLERDRVLDTINTQPKQIQLTLFSILEVCSKNVNSAIFTGEVFEIYRDACSKAGVKPLTQRRVSDIIAELDMLGIITAKVVSNGRYGRTRQISMAVPDSTISKINNLLKDGLNI